MQDVKKMTEGELKERGFDLLNAKGAYSQEIAKINQELQTINNELNERQQKDAETKDKKPKESK